MLTTITATEPEVCLPAEIGRNANAERQARWRNTPQGKAAQQVRAAARKKKRQDAKMARRQGLYMTFDGRTAGTRCTSIGKDKTSGVTRAG